MFKTGNSAISVKPSSKQKSGSKARKRNSSKDYPNILQSNRRSRLHRLSMTLD